jgi:anti-sigma factor RsiW
MNPIDERRREQISAYLDGELSPEESREVLAWLQAHPESLKAVEETRRVWDLLGAYGDEPVPEGFAERVLAAVREESGAADAAAGVDAATRRAGFRLLPSGRARAVAVAAAVLLALGAGALIGRTFGRGPSPVAPPAVASALDAVPPELLESDGLESLATLSDEEFETILTGDPSDLAQAGTEKNRGG